MWDALADSLPLSEFELESRSSLKAELMSLHKIEEMNLIQKSQLNWIRLGDENTSFFHGFLAVTKRKNLITELTILGSLPIPLENLKA